MRAGNRCDSVPPPPAFLSCSFLSPLYYKLLLLSTLIYTMGQGMGLSWQGLNVKIAAAGKVLQEGNLAFLKG